LNLTPLIHGKVTCAGNPPESSGQKAQQTTASPLPKTEAEWADFYCNVDWVFIAKKLEQEDHSIGISMDCSDEYQLFFLHQIGRSRRVFLQNKAPSQQDLSSPMTDSITFRHAISTTRSDQGRRPPTAY
jgi:hypothetical protein